MAGDQKRRPKKKQGRPQRDLELEAALLEDISDFISAYPALRERELREGIDLAGLIRVMIRLFDREFPETREPASTTEPFKVERAGDVSYDDAKSLYRQLSRYFAQRGMNKTSKAERQRWGRIGAAKRWPKIMDTTRHE